MILPNVKDGYKYTRRTTARNASPGFQYAEQRAALADARPMSGANHNSGGTHFARGLARLKFLFAAVNHGFRYVDHLLRKCSEAFRIRGFWLVFHIIVGLGLCNNASAGNQRSPV